MDSDFIFFKLGNGKIGIHNKEEGIGWIITPDKKMTRKDLIEWAKSELPKELEKKKKVKKKREGKRKRTVLEKVTLEKEDRICPNCKGIFHSDSEQRKFCNSKCSNLFSLKKIRKQQKERREKNEKG